ncbi:MAG TPA: hypothetical protein EYP82_07840 [Hydrogenothermaceae bacterium]|nr:hypothetical protein [Hydrogenothermaceae bacterium]
MSKREELEKQLEGLKAKLREEKKKERIKKQNEYIKQHYQRRSFYVPKEIEDKDYYIFLKLAKQLGMKTFKKENDYKIYYVEEEIKKFKNE